MQREPLYKIGDFVRIKDVARINEELGGLTKVQSGWVPPMDAYAGMAYRVKKVVSSARRGFHYSYQFEGTDLWWFSEDVLDDFLDERPIASNATESVISFEEVMGM